jgi:hypothetical protein
MRNLFRYLVPVFLTGFFSPLAIAAMVADSPKVAATENIYAEVSDAKTIISTIDSGLVSSYQDKDRAAWVRFYRDRRKELSKHLSRLPSQGLSASDTQAVASMRKQLTSFPENLSALFSPNGTCADAGRKNLDYEKLRAALVVCFVDFY